jgi:hypothetical protein
MKMDAALGEHLHSGGCPESPQFALGRVAIVPQIISAIAVVLAISAAFLLIALRLIHCIQPNLLPWTIKSAIPLILIGIAFASFQFAVPRSRIQILLGLIVAVAFILWGLEQFLSNPAVVSVIDDLVVFLFVLDLGIVICGSLKEQKNRK